MVRDEIPLVEPEFEFESRWWTNPDRTTIHRAGCRYAKVPFLSLADPDSPNWSDSRMRHLIETIFYLSACKVCWKDGPHG